MTVPLLGKGKISGDLRIVLNREKQAIEVHETAEVSQRWTAKPGIAEALDFGYTEAFTDTEGKQYGEKLVPASCPQNRHLNVPDPARSCQNSTTKGHLPLKRWASRGYRSGGC